MGPMVDRAVAAVLTVSDGISDGTRADESGDVAERLLREAGFEVGTRALVPDDRPLVEATLRELAGTNALVVTTGGTGFGPRDVTPEATRAVIDREAPGLAEVMRAAGRAETPMASLSRAVAGSIGGTLVLNLPGSPKGVRESLDAVLPVLPHAIELLGGVTGAHPTGHGEVRDPAGRGETSAGDRVEVRAIKVVEGDPPCRVGMHMTIDPGGPVHGTLGCAEFDEQAVEAAAEVWEAGEPGTRVLHHDLGDIEVVVQYPRPGLTRLPHLGRRFHGLLVELGAPQRPVDRSTGIDRHVHPHAARRIALDDLDGTHLDPVACGRLAATRRIAHLAVTRRMRAGHA